MNIYKFISVILALILAFILFIVVRVDYIDGVPKTSETTGPSNPESILLFINGANESDLISKFSYDSYIKNRNTINRASLKKDIKVLDSIFTKDKLQNKKLLSNALTESLFKEKKNVFEVYHPDELIKLMQWAEQFGYYTSMDPENDILYSSIRDFWMNQIANSLAAFSWVESSVKYDFKFRYLKTRLSEHGYDFGPKVTSMEKVIYNLIDSNWSHLFEASWNQASDLQKVLFFIVFIVTIYAYYLLLIKLLSFRKTK
jgi:hypothetical protein